MVVTPDIRGQQLRRNFLPSMGFFVTCLIALMFGLTRYVELGVQVQDDITQFYMWFIHVEIMVFIGFGFLMTYLRRYSLGAIMLNFLGSCLMFLVAILIVGAAQQTLGTDRGTVRVDMHLLIECTYCAATGMIAYGAVIGKATPTQLVWLMVALVPGFALNQYIVVFRLHILDLGGSNVIHLFGCYYGLAVSYVLSRNAPAHGVGHPKRTSSYKNDMSSMLGTLFLWVFWPSFNGHHPLWSRCVHLHGQQEELVSSVHAPILILPFRTAWAGHHPLWSRCVHLHGQQQKHVNGARAPTFQTHQTLRMWAQVITLSGAAVSTFMTSVLVGGRINPEHIQNATLAGGVAIGAACSLPITPAGAMVVGMAAGGLGTLGFEYLTPFLDTRLGLRDTCGIHNVHGLPGILGSFVAGLASLGMTTKDFFTRDCAEVTPRECGGFQLGYQIAGICVAMGISIVWGLIVGTIITYFNPLKELELSLVECFDDGPW
ncbi:ammonium transporter family-domain-containing protein [Dunaliella salina]|nr:ammonium transporter family-domain-containing protein [Dunaliella salina]|eukprot:KAF5839982.1 ammonium transporter family-domain-containing protein [Dunaliella salina]